MKPIAINGRFLTQPVTGVQRHARELILALDSMLADGELPPPAQPVELLAPSSLNEAPPLRFMKLRKVGRTSGQVWEQIELPALCHGRLLFTPCGGAPLLHRRHVFVLPDAAVFASPQAYTRAYGSWYRWHHRRAARLPGLRVLTVSEFSRHELAVYLDVDPARIGVIPLGHEHVLRMEPQTEILAKLGLAPGKYVLAVGSANPNKNFRGLLQAFSLLQRDHAQAARQVRLVIAGCTDGRIFGKNSFNRNDIVRTGYISDGELRALYENAACFVFPSFYEGFGLPLLEAMALGCPALSSSAASLTALGEGAALYFDPCSPQQIANAIAQVLADSAIRRELSEQGKLRAAQFRWRDTARQTWAALLDAA